VGVLETTNGLGSLASSGKAAWRVILITRLEMSNVRSEG